MVEMPVYAVWIIAGLGFLLGIVVSIHANKN